MATPEAPLKLPQVAEILGVHPKTARKLLAAGDIRARKTNGEKGTWLVTPKALDDYLTTAYDPRTGR